MEGSARKKSRGERTGTAYPIALEAVQKLDTLFDIHIYDVGKYVGKPSNKNKNSVTDQHDSIKLWIPPAPPVISQKSAIYCTARRPRSRVCVEDELMRQIGGHRRRCRMVWARTKALAGVG